MKRRLLIAAVFLLAGAVVNVAVAWWIAAAVDPFTTEWTTGAVWSSGDYWSVSRIRRPGSLHALSERHREVPAPDGIDPPGPAALAPSWSGFDVPSPGFASVFPDGDCRMVDARGWPALTLWYESETPDGWMPTGGIAGGIKLSGFWEHAVTRHPRALPLRPIWPGFVVNTLFYAAVLWLLICGPFALRRLVRVRRSLCPACAYPMGESDVCSECGKSLAGRMAVTT